MLPSASPVIRAVRPVLQGVALPPVSIADVISLPICRPLPVSKIASTIPPVAPPAAPARESGGRCAERGCVFPAVSVQAGKCLQHLRQSREPVLFSSWQPTRAVLERARFDLPNEDEGHSRGSDRRKLVAMREAFLEE